MNRNFRIASVQMSSVFADKETNLTNAEKLLESESWDLAVLPELFVTEFFAASKDSNLFSYAEPLHGFTVTRMAQMAKKKRGYLVVPFFERDLDGVYFNSAAFIDREGNILGVYRKTHIPFTQTYEKYYFSPGSSFPVFETDLGKLGILICYDRWYPEAWRKLVLAGAVIICIPIASWQFNGFSEIPIWDSLLRIRARENLVFVVAANRVGRERSYSYVGRSAIISPRGEIIAELDENEQRVVVVECDMDMVEKERRALPLLRDRRPEIY